MVVQILIKTNPKGQMPFKATVGSSGYDLFASEEVVISPQKFALVATDVYAEVPVGYELQIRSRSGLAAKHNVVVLNAPGTIDSDYRGELKVLLFNHGQEAFKVEVGMRIAQMVLCHVPQSELVEVAELTGTDRGSGGFGSTGLAK